MMYLNNLKDMMDAREARAKSINFRRYLLQRQKVKNCQNELDRINGEIAHNEMRGLTTHALTIIIFHVRY